MERHLFTIGDNGFYQDRVNTGLYAEILRTPGVKNPRVCLIPTASGDSQFIIDAFHEVFGGLGARTSVLSLFRGDREDFGGLIHEQDVIYVSGGNTRNMLVLWKEWGLGQMLRSAYERGVVLAGGSAGSLCWYESGVTDSIPGRLTGMKCLGWLKGSHCPHYDEPGRRDSFLELLRSGSLPGGYGAENGVALHFVDEDFHEAISAFHGKKAFQTEWLAGILKESEIPVRTL
jgi:dipeptidase E